MTRDFPSLGKTGKQPPRSESDGPVGIRVLAGTRLCITATQDGRETELVVSAHNAWRVFGLLTFVLGVKLPAKLMKEILL